jgi:hypothetical protein
MSGETMEQSYAVVDTATAKVVNVVVWDGVQPYDPGEGLTIVPLPFEDVDGARQYVGGIGWDYNPKGTKYKFVDNRPKEDFDELP